MKFKTNAKCKGCETAIKNALAPLAPAADWEMDLVSPDKTLFYLGSEVGNEFAEKVVKLITDAGFQAERLD